MPNHTLAKQQFYCSFPCSMLKLINWLCNNTCSEGPKCMRDYTSKTAWSHNFYSYILKRWEVRRIRIQNACSRLRGRTEKPRGQLVIDIILFYNDYFGRIMHGAIKTNFFNYRSFSLTWSVAPVGWWNNTKYLNKKELIPVPYTNMAAISLFWYTNMAAVTSDENDLFTNIPFTTLCESSMNNQFIIIKITKHITKKK